MTLETQMEEPPTLPFLGGGDISGALPVLEFGELLQTLLRPSSLAAELPRLSRELIKVGMGLATVEVPSRDPQFADDAWRDHIVFRSIAQAYLAWAGVVERLVQDDGDDWQRTGRAHMFSDIVTGALSPANFLLTNPAALRRAVETGGQSIVHGLRNWVDDLVHNGGMPRMVDTTPYTVGGNLACSPGAVVYREEMFELLQYQPTTPTTYERPLLFVPPQMNRFYILDLAPGRSLVEFAVSQGLQTFMLVWRNPSANPGSSHGRWGLGDYVAAAERAFDIVREITERDDLNVLGFCAGGVTSALAQAHLTATGTSPVHASTYLVTLLDGRRPNMVTTLDTPSTHKAMNVRAKQGAVTSGRDIGRHFAWMRPKDLVYQNAVRNWVMGQDPTPFDLLAWNDDAANVSSTFTNDSINLIGSGALLQPGGALLLGAPIDLSTVKADNFIVAAQTDHITTWRPCYMTSQALGGASQMVLINKGHIQSVVSPIPKSRHKLWMGLADEPDPDSWLNKAEQHDGSWWPHWAEWITQRSGERVTAPVALGGVGYPPREPAPGRYVHE